MHSKPAAIRMFMSIARRRFGAAYLLQSRRRDLHRANQDRLDGLVRILGELDDCCFAIEPDVKFGDVRQPVSICLDAFKIEGSGRV